MQGDVITHVDDCDISNWTLPQVPGTGSARSSSRPAGGRPRRPRPHPHPTPPRMRAGIMRPGLNAARDAGGRACARPRLQERRPSMAAAEPWRAHPAWACRPACAAASSVRSGLFVCSGSGAVRRRGGEGAGRGSPLGPLCRAEPPSAPAANPLAQSCVRIIHLLPSSPLSSHSTPTTLAAHPPTHLAHTSFAALFLSPQPPSS